MRTPDPCDDKIPSESSNMGNLGSNEALGGLGLQARQAVTEAEHLPALALSNVLTPGPRRLDQMLTVYRRGRGSEKRGGGGTLKN